MKARGCIVRNLMVMGAPLVVVGCATSGSGGATAAALPPCQVETDDSRDWRQVTTDLLSFCVPAGWTARGQNEWQGRGGSIRWGPGTRPASVGTGSVAAGGGGDPSIEANRGQEERFNEVIGGVPVELWVARVESLFQTGAEWRTPREAHMRGTATSEAAADLQLNIFRTARLEGGS
jgi:hypothetical protein